MFSILLWSILLWSMSPWSIFAPFFIFFLLFCVCFAFFDVPACALWLYATRASFVIDGVAGFGIADGFSPNRGRRRTALA